MIITGIKTGARCFENTVTSISQGSLRRRTEQRTLEEGIEGAGAYPTGWGRLWPEQSSISNTRPERAAFWERGNGLP